MAMPRRNFRIAGGCRQLLLSGDADVFTSTGLMPDPVAACLYLNEHDFVRRP
jgi:hypothetical protein